MLRFFYAKNTQVILLFYAFVVFSKKVACLAGFLVGGIAEYTFFAAKMVPYGTIIQRKWYHTVPFFT